MPWKSAVEIELSEKAREILKEYERGTHSPHHLKIRSEIILRSSEGESNNQIEREMGKDAKTVQRWRDRYSASMEELGHIETEIPHKLRRSIERVLSDAARSGGPCKFGEEQVAAILALACEDPASLGLPFSHWSSGLLRIEAIKLGIVEEISVRQVGRFLKSGGFEASPKPILAES
jgi:transposase